MPYRSPEAGCLPNIQVLQDFHNLGVKRIDSCVFLLKIGLLELLMKIEIPLPQKMVNTTAPTGASAEDQDGRKNYLPFFMVWV